MSNKVTYDMLNTTQQHIVDTVSKKIQTILSGNLDDYSEEERMFHISGFSGSGKSTTISLLLSKLLENNPTLDIKMTCPTHKALATLKTMAGDLNIEATTIHSFLNCKLTEDYTEGKNVLVKDYEAEQKFATIICCDEASMISPELYDMLYNEVLAQNVGIVIFSGDKNQLEPVDGNIFPLYNDPDLVEEFSLTEIMRQAKDNPIISLGEVFRYSIANNEYKSMTEYIDIIKSFAGEHIEIIPMQKTWLERVKEIDTDDFMYLCHQNKTLSLYNKKVRELLLGKEQPYIIEGEKLVFNEAHFAGKDCKHQNNEVVTVASATLHYDDENELSYWKCTSVEKGEVFKVIDRASSIYYDDMLSDIAKDAKKATGAARSALWARFFQLKNEFQKAIHTYATTIMKSQGSSIDTVFIDLSEIKNASNFLHIDKICRLLYVGITRAKNKVIFFTR